MFGVVDPGFGIGDRLLAMVTACFPLVTAKHIKVGTLTGEGPAVVECPDCRNIIFFYVGK